MIGTKEYSSEQDLVEETYRQLELQYDVKWIWYDWGRTGYDEYICGDTQLSWMGQGRPSRD